MSKKKIVRPYGDTTGDGMVQVSFTLPVPHDKRAEGAALQLAKKMGMDPAMVVHAKPMGPDFTFFVVYGRVHHLVDLSAVQVVEREYPLLSPKEVNAAIKPRLRRKLVVVGACIGTDAHTVGIDAILNIKGFAGEKGLEYYREFKVVNLGAQVLVPDLVARARAEKADAVLVSPGGDPARRAPAQHPRDVGRVPRGLPGRPAPAAGRRRPALRRARHRGARRRPHLRPRHHARRGGQLPRARPDRPADRRSRPHDRATDPTAQRRASPSAPDGGLSVTHRRYVPYSHAHYAGNLVDGAYVLGLFGDVATEVCIRTDGDEGLFASYSDVQFRAPVRAGDVVEVEATVTRVGTRSRTLEFVAPGGVPGRRAAGAAGRPPTCSTRRSSRDRDRHRRRPAAHLGERRRRVNGPIGRLCLACSDRTRRNPCRSTKMARSGHRPAHLRRMRIGAGQAVVDKTPRTARRLGPSTAGHPLRLPLRDTTSRLRAAGRRNAQAPSGCQVRSPPSHEPERLPSGVRHGKGPTAQ